MKQTLISLLLALLPFVANAQDAVKIDGNMLKQQRLWTNLKDVVPSNDVTHFIQNAGFDEDLTWHADGSKKEIVDQSKVLSNRSLAGIAADSSLYALVSPSNPNRRSDGRTQEATNGFIGRIQGWNIETNKIFPDCEWVYFGTIPYALAPQSMPIADDGSTCLEVPARPKAYSGDDNIGFAYLRSGWGGRAVYKQEVKLPCAIYRFEYWAINLNPNGKNGKNLSKVICCKDTLEDKAGLSDTEWTLHTIEFTAKSEFIIQIGFESSGGSGSNPIVCIDGVKLYKISEIQKCDTPIITFADNVLSFSCETEGVEFVYDVKLKETAGTGNKVQLTPTYTVSVYATKEGYGNSDVASKEITVVPGDISGDEKVDATDLTKLIDILLKR